MNKYLRTVVKGLVDASCMVAANEVIGYHASPYKAATASRLLCNIAGASIGLFIGDRVSETILNRLEDILILSGLEDTDGTGE